MIYSTWDKEHGRVWVYSCGACPFRTMEAKRKKAVEEGREHFKQHPAAEEAIELREALV